MTLATKEVYEHLSKLVNYDPETGFFIWSHRDGSDEVTRRWNTRYSGTEAGTKSHGYLLIGITFNSKKIKIRAHRLAWFKIYGKIPSDQIDHINHKRDDNRISNLRDVTNQDNNKNRPIQKNNKSGFNGVIWSKHASKWVAYCKIDRKKKHIGYFDTAEMANDAVIDFREKNGFHKLHGETK
jgi:hypothetical protein